MAETIKSLDFKRWFNSKVESMYLKPCTMEESDIYLKHLPSFIQKSLLLAFNTEEEEKWLDDIDTWNNKI